MNNKPKVYIISSGMITAVGANVGMTSASVRAMLSGIKETSEHDSNADPFKIGSVPEDALSPLDDSLNNLGLTARQRRLLRLSVPAVQEAMQVYSENAPIPLLLVGPESLPGRSSIMTSHFIQYLSIQTGVKFDPQISRVFSTGRAGGFQAIDMAFRYFEATDNELALIGGIDTYADLHLLATLDQDERILTEDSKDAFLPGEAAGFLLIISEKGRQNLKTNSSLTALYTPGITEEPGHRYSNIPYRGDGLAESFRQSINNAEGQKISSIYSSLNGENFGAKEYAVAMTRNSDALSDNIQFEHPADCFGDIGAAFVPVLIGLLSIQKRQQHQASIVYCSSEGSLRGSIVVS